MEKTVEEPELQGELIQAEIRQGKISVENEDMFSELEQLGYGEREGKRYVLKDHEALYLLHSKKLKLSDGAGHEVSFDRLADEAQKRSKDSWTRFIIYRDLRSRGYVARNGFGFGTDLRVYERGDFPRKAAKYVVFALDEGAETSVSEQRDSVRQIVKMGKEAIAAVIERRGEVIYYKVTKRNFNKK